MNKKKFILLICLFVLPFIVSVGFSSWIIINEVDVKPTYGKPDYSSISNRFVSGESFVYDGNTHKPRQADGYEPIAEELITYSYRKYLSKDEFTAGLPVNRGSYDVKVEVKDLGETTVQLIITAKKIKIENYEFDYTNLMTWVNFKTQLKNQMIFKDESGNNLSNQSELRKKAIVSGMTNGLASYTYSDSVNANDKNIAGSTYLLTIKFSDDNYEIINEKTTYVDNINKTGEATVYTIVKYKTVVLTNDYNTFYTVEDAIAANNSSDITLAGGSNGNYVETSFTALTSDQLNPYNKTTFNLTKNLYVPYKVNDNNNKVGATVEKENFNGNTAGGKVFSVLNIPSGITLNIKSGRKIAACAKIGSQQPILAKAMDRGVIINDGTINVESNASIIAYGYIKGSGSGNIELASGASAIDCFTVYDWPGGSAAVGGASNILNVNNHVYKKVIPFKMWTCHNISCCITIQKDAKYDAYMLVYASNEEIAENIRIFGSNSDSSLFKIGNGYVKKRTASIDEDTTDYNTLYSVTGDNQTLGQRDYIGIYGDLTDGTIKISIKVDIKISTISVDISTSVNVALPITSLNINIHNGTTTLKSSSYTFFPGTSLYVSQGAKLNIDGGVNLTFLGIDDIESAIIVDGQEQKHADNYSDPQYVYNKMTNMMKYKNQYSKVIINGTVQCTNGNLGGYVESYYEGAKFVMGSSNSYEYKYMCSFNSPYYTTKTVTSKGKIDSANFSQFGTKTAYVSYKANPLDPDDKEYYWIAATDAKTLTINFYDNSTLINSTDILILKDSANQYVYTITGNEYIYNNEYYDLIRWTTSDGNNASGISLTLTDNMSIDLYAVTEEHVFTIEYMGAYLSNNEPQMLTEGEEYRIESKLESFTISDLLKGSVKITSIPSYALNGVEKPYNAWFLGNDDSVVIPNNELTKDLIDSYIEKAGNRIILYCKFTDEVRYDVGFMSNVEGLDIAPLTSVTFEELIKRVNELSSSLSDDYDNDADFAKYFNNQWFIDGNPGNIFDKTKAPDNKNFILHADWKDKKIITYSFTYKVVNNNYTGLNTKEHSVSKYWINSDNVNNAKFNEDLIPNECRANYTFSNWIVNSNNKTKDELNNNLADYSDQIAIAQLNPRKFDLEFSLTDGVNYNINVTRKDYLQIKIGGNNVNANSYVLQNYEFTTPINIQLYNCVYYNGVFGIGAGHYGQKFALYCENNFVFSNVHKNNTGYSDAGFTSQTCYFEKTQVDDSTKIFLTFRTRDGE